MKDRWDQLPERVRKAIVRYLEFTLDCDQICEAQISERIQNYESCMREAGANDDVARRTLAALHLSLEEEFVRIRDTREALRILGVK